MKNSELQLPNNPIIQNRIYTQLAKNGRFDELPATCEFSESVELEVWDDELSRDFRKITGKFKGNYMDIHCIGWKNVKLPTKKIDFSDFKTGDVVEVDFISDEFNEKIIGYIYYISENLINLTPVYNKEGRTVEEKEIKSITKIK